MKRCTAFVAKTFVLLTVSGVASMAGTLCASVVDVTGAGIPGTTAKAVNEDHRYEGTTDPEGRVCFRSMHDGDYAFSLAIVGFLPVTYQVPVRNEHPQDLKVTMLFDWTRVIAHDITPSSGIRGTVTQRGSPLGEVEICFRGKYGEVCRWTDPLGRYAALLSQGKQSVEVKRLGRIVLRENFEIRPEAKQLDLKVP